MAGKYKTMTLVEEAELDRLRQRQIKDYNPSLKSLVKIQEQIDNIFQDSELGDDSKSKILAHLQERFGFLLKKFKYSAPSTNAPTVAPDNAAPVAPMGAAADEEQEAGDPQEADDEEQYGTPIDSEDEAPGPYLLSRSLIFLPNIQRNLNLFKNSYKIISKKFQVMLKMS
ncbi:MAG: hypothetical protein FD143_3634 [Ignavibacteria bacterium]|nr:MAG: hypothetical protein FD143_3634 [Ignavibacteria bacterium]